jgi:hypothetical protein
MEKTFLYDTIRSYSISISKVGYQGKISYNQRYDNILEEGKSGEDYLKYELNLVYDNIVNNAWGLSSYSNYQVDPKSTKLYQNGIFLSRKKFTFKSVNKRQGYTIVIKRIHNDENQDWYMKIRTKELQTV